MATDTAVLELLVRWMEVSCSPDDAGAAGLTEVEAKTMLDFIEACEAGYNLGLRGRELIDAAMGAVRFDEVGVEASTAIVQTMIDERTDTQRIDALQRAIDAHSCVEFTNAGRNDVRESLDLFLAQEAEDIQLAEDKWRGVAAEPERKA